MDGACSTNGGEQKHIQVIGGEARGKGPLGRPRRRWVDNIGMNLGEVGGGDVDWSGLGQDSDRWRALVIG
jgi:hypothetical protein